MALNAELFNFLRRNLRGSIVDVNEFIISNTYLFLSKKEKLNHYFNGEDLTQIAFDMNRHYDEEILHDFESRLNSLTRDSINDLIQCTVSGKINDFRFRDLSSTDEICKLVLELLDLKKGGDIVLDIGSGIGNFLFNTCKFGIENHICFKELRGIELNQTQAYLSAMALACLSNNVNDVFINCGNVLDGIDGPYTKAYLFPPFGLKLANLDRGIASLVFDYAFTVRNSVEWIFIDKMLGSICGSHKSVALVTPKALFNNADKQYRNELLKRGLIEAIIELPNGSIESISQKTCLIVFSENNSEVKIVDATNILGDSKKSLKIVLPYEKIIDMVNSEDVIRIKNNDLMDLTSICPSNLLELPEEPKNGVMLSEIAEIITGAQYTLKNFEGMLSNQVTGYRILTSSDINDGIVEWNRLQSIDYKDTKFDKYAIRKNDIVVTTKSSKVKTVVVDIDPKEKIIVTGGMIIVRPDVERINPTYFKLFLDSEIGQKVLKSIQKGSIIININSKDLATILVPLIDINKQDKVAELYNSKFSSYIAYKKELEKIENKLKNFYMDECVED